MVEGGVGAADATDEDEQGTGGTDEDPGGNDPGTGGTDEVGGSGVDGLTDGADQDMEDLDEEQEAAANSGGRSTRRRHRWTAHRCRSPHPER